MPFTYSKYIGWHETAPENKVEVEAFSDRGAKMKARKVLGSNADDTAIRENRKNKIGEVVMALKEKVILIAKYIFD